MKKVKRDIEKYTTYYCVCGEVIKIKQPSSVCIVCVKCPKANAIAFKLGLSSHVVFPFKLKIEKPAWW